MDSDDLAAPSERGRVAACISGEARFVGDNRSKYFMDLPCALPSIVKHIILPLSAHVYCFLNAPPAQVNVSRAIAQRLLEGTDLQVLQVDEVGARPSMPVATCPDGAGANNGYAQSRGFMQCAAAALPHGYDWILRLRPDMSSPYTLSSLPTRFPFETPHGLVIVPATARCDCGAAQPGITTGKPPRTAPPPPDPGVRECTRDTLCGCAVDTFAMVYGRHAQHALFAGYAEDFDSCSRHNFSRTANGRTGCGVCAFGGRGKDSSPECKLGASLAYRNVPLYEISRIVDPTLPVVLKRHPNFPNAPSPNDNQFKFKGMALVHRYFDCEGAVRTPPIVIHPKNLHALPPGLKTPESMAVHARMCGLPPRNRSDEFVHTCARREPLREPPSPPASPARVRDSHQHSAIADQPPPGPERYLAPGFWVRV